MRVRYVSPHMNGLGAYGAGGVTALVNKLKTSTASLKPTTTPELKVVELPTTTKISIINVANRTLLAAQQKIGKPIDNTVFVEKGASPNTVTTGFVSTPSTTGVTDGGATPTTPPVDPQQIYTPPSTPQPAMPVPVYFTPPSAPPSSPPVTTAEAADAATQAAMQAAATQAAADMPLPGWVLPAAGAGLLVVGAMIWKGKQGTAPRAMNGYRHTRARRR